VTLAASALQPLEAAHHRGAAAVLADAFVDDTASA
jgi:hypothetical protein